eukprot:4035278-Amphidinium_carterae.3
MLLAVLQEHSLPRDAWGPSLSSLLRVSSQSSLQKAPRSHTRAPCGRKTNTVETKIITNNFP